MKGKVQVPNHGTSRKRSMGLIRNASLETLGPGLAQKTSVVLSRTATVDRIGAL